MISAAPVAVLAENHSNRVAAVDFFNRAGEFAGRRIGVFDFSIAREDAHTMGAARCGVGADDVIVEHRADGVALLLGPIQQAVRAEQSLLFAGEHAKDQGGAEAPKLSVTVGFGPAQLARAFHTDGGAGSVVVCARLVP